MQQPSQTHTTGKAVGKLSGHLTSSEHWALLDTVRDVLSGTSPHQSAPNQVPFPQVLPAHHCSYHRFYVRLWEIHRDLTASSTILSLSAQQFFKGRVRSAQKRTGIPLETHLEIFCKWLLGRGTKKFRKGINVHGCFPTCWCRHSVPRQEVTTSSGDEMNCWSWRNCTGQPLSLLPHCVPALCDFQSHQSATDHDRLAYCQRY